MSMKKLLILTLLALPTFAKSQVIEASIFQWETFECNFTEDYFKVISDTTRNLLSHGFGENKLTFDLQANTYAFYFQNQKSSDGEMKYELKHGVYIFVCKTVDNNTNEPMELFVTINTKAMKSTDPYVTQFYSDINTNKSYGMISYFE
jgi:hypothetical protein